MRTVLIVFVVVVVYCLFVLARPTGRCGRCAGARVVKGRKCPSCRGHGKRRRFGSKVVHAFFWSVVGEYLMERRRDRRQDEGDG